MRSCKVGVCGYMMALEGRFLFLSCKAGVCGGCIGGDCDGVVEQMFAGMAGARRDADEEDDRVGELLGTIP